MTRRLYAILLSCLFLVTFNYSCVDHDMPSVLPELKTLNVTGAPSGIKCGTYFTADLVSIGTTPIKEYGVVITAFGLNALHPEPVVSTDYKVVFDSPIVTGQKSKVGPQVCTNNMYYRAYAILVDDTVVYGNVIHFTNF